MSEARPVSEFDAGLYAAAYAGVPLVALSLPPAIFQNTPEHQWAFRDWDPAGVTDFFNHTGNFFDGTLLAICTISVGSWADRHITDDYQRQMIVGTTAGGVLVSSGINFAYEATIAAHPRHNAPPHDIDIADALYGSFAGALVSVAFCAAALWQRARLRRAGD